MEFLNIILVVTGVFCIINSLTVRLTETAEETESRIELIEKYPKEEEEKVQKNQFSSTERSTQTKM